jgi:uncharacterized protein with von Willebrand factor type A (vWA) domain
MSQLREIDWDAKVVDGGTDATASPTRLRISPQAVQADEWTQGKVEEIAEGTDAFCLEWAKRDRKALTDAFAACFEPYPQLEESVCEEQDRKDFFSGVLKSQDFEELHANTELNIDASAVGALSLTDQYAEYAVRPKPKNEAKRRMQAEQEGRKAAQNACNEAQSAAALEEMCGGSEPGDNRGTPLGDAIERMRRLQKNKRLQEIIRRAGKFQRLAAQMQRNKRIHSEDEVAGVEFGNRLHKLLPVELAKANDPTLEWDLLRRFAERQCLCWEMSQSAEEQRGPILVLIDESGSMEKEKILEAKALGLAVSWIARKQKRDLTVTAWSSAAQVKSWKVPKGKWDECQLEAWAGHFFAGGTDFPLDELKRLAQEPDFAKGRTDVVLITDGAFGACDLGGVKSWKEANRAKMLSLAIEMDVTDTLRAISDEAFSLDDWSPNEGIRNVLSI